MRLDGFTARRFTAHPKRRVDVPPQEFGRRTPVIFPYTPWGIPAEVTSLAWDLSLSGRDPQTIGSSQLVGSASEPMSGEPGTPVCAQLQNWVLSGLYMRRWKQ